MAIGGDLYTFNEENVNRAPEKHGVYALYDGSTLIYIGRAAGDGVTIRGRLQSHFRGDEGNCTKQATRYRREVTESATSRERELLEEYQGSHGGKLPRCNERSA